MKFKTTKTAVMNGYTNIICIGYCNLQHLLRHTNPVAYITRREGWSCDVYELAPGVALSTGYGPIGNIRPPYELQKKYDDAAAGIISKYSFDYETQKRELEKLVKKFLSEIL